MGSTCRGYHKTMTRPAGIKGKSIADITLAIAYANRFSESTEICAEMKISSMTLNKHHPQATGHGQRAGSSPESEGRQDAQ